MEPLTKMGLRVLMLYSSTAPNFQELVRQTSRDAAATNHAFELFDTKGLTPSDEERFLTDIRIIRPQVRGQVKSGGGSTLPISNKVRLNVSIPILMFYEGLKPVDVYPKDLKGIRYDLASAFKNPGAAEDLSVEDCITTILSSRPQLLGSKLELVDTELGTGSGVADLLFKDSDGLYMLVEVKGIADQETVGQVLKQSEGLKSKLGLSQVRNAIVALRTSGNVFDACKAAGVELYMVEARKHL